MSQIEGVGCLGAVFSFFALLAVVGLGLSIDESAEKIRIALNDQAAATREVARELQQHEAAAELSARVVALEQTCEVGDE